MSKTKRKQRQTAPSGRGASIRITRVNPDTGVTESFGHNPSTYRKASKASKAFVCNVLLGTA